MTKSPPKNLTVFKVRPQREAAAVQDIRSAGHRAHVVKEPRTIRASRHAKRKIIRHKPSAPGYVFGTGHPGVKHVQQAVRTGKRIGDFKFVTKVIPASENITAQLGSVARSEVTAMVRTNRNQVTKGRHVRAQADAPKLFAIGQTVTITKGPFEGKSGTIASHRNKKLSMVSIEGRQIAVPNRLMESATSARNS